jgi:hypothetical protein
LGSVSTSFASATAPSSGGMPLRVPTATSITTSAVTPASRAAAERSLAFCSVSVAWMNCADCFRSCIARRIFAGERLLVVMQMRSMPSVISASASPSFAVQIPVAPAASCIFAMSALLCVLACGRVAMPNRFAAACMVAMFRSSRSRSTQRAGVSRSHFDVPAGVSSRIATSSAL